MLLRLGFFFVSFLVSIARIHPSFLSEVWGLVSERDGLSSTALLSVSVCCFWARPASVHVGRQSEVFSRLDLDSEIFLLGILLWWRVDLKMWQIHFIDFKMFFLGCEDIWALECQPRGLIRLQQISCGQVKMGVFVFLPYWMDILFLTFHQLFLMSEGVFCKPILLWTAFLLQVELQEKVLATGLCPLTSLS